MNQNLKKCIELYATSEVEFFQFLNSLSKPDIQAVLIDLLTVYFNDKNSSTLRELVSLYIAGFEPSKKKLGYKFLAYIYEKLHCEVKPVNTDSIKRKLNRQKSFNDYTFL